MQGLIQIVYNIFLQDTTIPLRNTEVFPRFFFLSGLAKRREKWYYI